ncbi:hypothetical protein Gorai_013727, partial [Gossypium raimondii]|nr:hypothetical protein [Gossypium raimondii]
MIVATLKESCKNIRVYARYNICQRARRGVLKEKKGFYIDEYVNLWGYAVELISSNPGSTVSIQVHRDNDGKAIFYRLYACLAGLKQGWEEGYKPFIVFDGCFLNSVCKRELLAVVGRDGNNQMFPVGWAVEGEGKQSWKWFLENLMKHQLSIDLRPTSRVPTRADNNMAKTSNGWLLDARCNSIITMLEDIRILKNIEQSTHSRLIWNGDGRFE